MNPDKLQRIKHGLSVLKQIKQFVPNVILAGGAIRDAYHNKEIKDYDFFVSAHNTDADIYDEDFWVETLNLSSGVLCDYIDNVSDNETGSCSREDAVDIVWEIEKHSGEIYNIVVLNVEPEEYVNEDFDIGLCKAYTDGKRLRLTADFMHDSRHHLLSVVQKSKSKEDFFYMMDNHVYRLKQKYPGWKLVIPERFQQYYEEWSKIKC